MLCFDRAFWTEVVNIDALMAEGMISAADRERLTFADDAEGAWAALAATGILDDRL